jgi:hypothetical protein
MLAVNDLTPDVGMESARRSLAGIAIMIETLPLDQAAEGYAFFSFGP